LVWDERITSLKSNWILSISAPTKVDLEAAIWWACSKKGLELLEGDVGFAIAFGGAIPTDGVFGSALQLNEDRALLYTIHTGLEH
jgi:hypothetical protein